MKSLADYLPPEFAAFVHPDWRKNEVDYWAMRDQLLEQYQGLCIGFANGAVVASGKSPVEVLHAAHRVATHPFTTCVGREDEPDRIRSPREVFVNPDQQAPSDCKRNTMKSIADMLPPEIAAQLHPDLLKNEADYWKARDLLVEQYAGQWVGFADGTVIASGSDPVKVLHEAQNTDRHPHVTCVGREFDAVRIRRAGFPYDTSYSTAPMPVIDVMRS